MGTQIRFKVDSTAKSSTKALTNKRVLCNKKAKNVEREGEKLRIQ